MQRFENEPSLVDLHVEGPFFLSVLHSQTALTALHSLHCTALH